VTACGPLNHEALIAKQDERSQEENEEPAEGKDQALDDQVLRRSVQDHRSDRRLDGERDQTESDARGGAPADRQSHHPNRLVLVDVGVHEIQDDEDRKQQRGRDQCNGERRKAASTMTAAVPSPRASRKLVREFRGRHGNGVDTTAGRATPSLGAAANRDRPRDGPEKPAPSGAPHRMQNFPVGVCPPQLEQVVIRAPARRSRPPRCRPARSSCARSPIRQHATAEPLREVAGTRRLGVQVGQARIIMEQVIRRSPAAQNDPMPTGLCVLMTSAARTAFSNRLPELPKGSIATRVERPIDELGLGRERSCMRTLRKQASFGPPALSEEASGAGSTNARTSMVTICRRLISTTYGFLRQSALDF